MFLGGGGESTKPIDDISVSLCATLSVMSFKHTNPLIHNARRVIFIDLENCHSELFYLPCCDEIVLGFVHKLGLHCVKIERARYPLRIIDSMWKDAADTHLVFELSRLLTGGTPFIPGLEVIVVTKDHVGEALGDVVRFYYDTASIRFQHVQRVPPSHTVIMRRNSF